MSYNNPRRALSTVFGIWPSAQQMVVAADSILIKGCLGVITVFLCFCVGQASFVDTEQSGKLPEFMSNLAWDFAIKEGFRVFKEMPATKPSTRSYHTQAGHSPCRAPQA